MDSEWHTKIFELAMWPDHNILGHQTFRAGMPSAKLGAKAPRIFLVNFRLMEA